MGVSDLSIHAPRFAGRLPNWALWNTILKSPSSTGQVWHPLNPRLLLLCIIQFSSCLPAWVALLPNWAPFYLFTTFNTRCSNPGSHQKWSDCVRLFSVTVCKTQWIILSPSYATILGKTCRKFQLSWYDAQGGLCMFTALIELLSVSNSGSNQKWRCILCSKKRLSSTRAAITGNATANFSFRGLIRRKASVWSLP